MRLYPARAFNPFSSTFHIIDFDERKRHTPIRALCGTLLPEYRIVTGQADTKCKLCTALEERLAIMMELAE